MSIQHLAIFAGAGELPFIAAESALAQGVNFSIYHIGETNLDVRFVHAPGMRMRTISLGAIGKTFEYLNEDKTSHIVLLGKIEKQRMLQDVKRDAAAEEIYQAAIDRRDDTLFHQFALGITKMGIQILPQKEFLSQCFLSPGIHTLKKPELPALLEDIEFGFSLSQRIGSLDIGQTAIVFEKMILAVEAIEGTDAAISRAGSIARGQGGVVCKTAKASQDPRFDLPAVGVATLEVMAKAGMHVLVIEAAQTLVVNPAAFIQRANELGLIVIAK